jgi:uncharacterized iron-regulated protein
MKKLIVIAMLLIASAAWADTKEVLTLKAQLYQEQMARIQAQVQIASAQYNEAKAALEAVNKELKALAEKEKAEKKEKK